MSKERVMTNKLEKVIEKLNKEQKAAVLYTNGPLRIIAGAGTGKTTVLTHKIAYLLKIKNIDPNKLAAITFTNKAANEMIHRVTNLVGNIANDIQISTYHSLAVRILREEISYFKYPKYFTIMDNVDQKQLLAPIYKKHNITPQLLPYGNMIDFISKRKISFISPEESYKEAHTDGERQKSQIYKDYNIAQKKAFALDFDDLLIFTYKLFKYNLKARKKWSKMFDYLLIDEFQDTSEVQYELIKMFSVKNTIIVGDPDQTIYSWRGANVDIILNFHKDFTNVRTIKLEKNYRSTQKILKHANKLIRHNSKRLSKNLYSENSIGIDIQHQNLFSPSAEARWVVKEVKNLQTQKIRLKNIAILYRANYLSKNMEQALIQENISYRIFGSLKFFERREIKDALAYLRILANDDDYISFFRMINTPSRKIGETTIEKLMKTAAKNNISLMKLVMNNLDSLDITNAQKKSLDAYVKLIKKYKMAMKSYKPSTILLNFLQEVKYIDMWKRVDEHERLINLKELMFDLKDWERKNPKSTITNYLQKISLYTDNEHVDNITSFISLMTIHSAKGLEFDYIFVIGMSEGIFPSNKALAENPISIEEERRLAYVAITRARKMVYLSSSSGYSMEAKLQKAPSRFIKEIGIKKDKFEFKNYSIIDYDKNYNKENINWVVGDKLIHKIFGKGTVVQVDNDTIKIVFKKPYNTKSLMKNHNSIIRR